MPDLNNELVKVYEMKRIEMQLLETDAFNPEVSETEQVWARRMWHFYADMLTEAGVYQSPGTLTEAKAQRLTPEYVVALAVYRRERFQTGR